MLIGYGGTSSSLRSDLYDRVGGGDALRQEQRKGKQGDAASGLEI